MTMLLPALMISLSLGTAALEIASGVALVAALTTRRRPPADLLQPVLAVAALSLVASLGEGALRDGAAVGWMLCLAVAVPLLPGDRTKAAHIGASAAAVLGLGSLLWALGSSDWPARGVYSHHLTLGTVLLLPLAAAVQRGWWRIAAGCAAGVAATLSLGPALGAVVAVVGARSRPLWALVGGVAVSVAVLAAWQGEGIVLERTILWASGAEVLSDHPLGVGPGADRAALSAAQHRLVPGFHFPHHAHDAALQIGVRVGWAGWLAWAWLLVALWRRADSGGRAGIAAVVVGGLTQDTLGDLEVSRALCAWVLVCEPLGLSTVTPGDDKQQVAPEA